MSTIYNRWPSSSGVSTPIPINQGGTGQTSQQAAINALTGTQSSGKYLRSNGTNATLSSLAAADMTGAIAITNGGTGQTTADAALNALLPAQTSQSGKFLTTDGTSTSWATAGGGGGLVAPFIDLPNTTFFSAGPGYGDLLGHDPTVAISNNTPMMFGSPDWTTAGAPGKTLDTYIIGGTITDVTNTHAAGDVQIVPGFNNGTGKSGDLYAQSGDGLSGIDMFSTNGATPSFTQIVTPKLKIQDGSQGTSGQVWTSTDNAGSGHWAAPASYSPQFFVSSACTTGSGANTSTTFAAFDNTPTLTFTPTVTGTYKVYTSAPLTNTSNAGAYGVVRVANSAGGATVTQEMQANVQGPQNLSTSVYISTVCALTAGTRYSFQIQGKFQAGGTGGLFLEGNNAQFYLFAEMVSL